MIGYIVFVIMILGIIWFFLYATGCLSNFFNPKYDFYSCRMESKYIRTCFIFRAKTEDELVKKIERQGYYGWYYDGCLRKIDMQRAKELIDAGARIVR